MNRIERFYTEVLGLDKLGSFEKHDGYDGIFLGKEGFGWHLEFTTSMVEPDHYFDEDDILIFYPPSRDSFNVLLQNIHRHQVEILTAKNPYWNANGVLISDPDGCHVIISDSRVKDG